ncbi:MAG: hypothetical protein RIQ38_2761 [Pseudomonadota bacterium]|jgi:long-chain fatty acid transport protein
MNHHVNFVFATLSLAVSTAWATNGMMMEGYGPESLAMGGASVAFDNGTAAMMNNPATLQLGANGSRLDVALGQLGPNVRAGVAKSGGTSYLMPALGWVRKNNDYSWGIGMFGQGGMGTEYIAGAMGNGQAMRSEVAVGRVIFPVSMKLSEQVNVGATVDYTWGSMDLIMETSAAQLAGMYAAAGNTSPPPLPGATAGARLAFSDGSKFSGAAKATGWTGKLGMTFDASPTLRLGVSHQLKTHLADMRTGASSANMALFDALGASLASMDGQIVVRNFQMPASTTVGLAWQATPALGIALDLKTIAWSSAMASFNMSFTPVGGAAMTFSMPQNWKDQTVTSVGASYRLNEAVVLRAGYSHASNPVPDATVNPLFPAIVKDHFMLGVGVNLNKSTALNMAVSHAPKVTVTSPSAGTISHSQTNWQLMLTHRY